MQTHVGNVKCTTSQTHRTTTTACAYTTTHRLYLHYGVVCMRLTLSWDV